MQKQKVTELLPLLHDYERQRPSLFPPACSIKKWLRDASNRKAVVDAGALLNVAGRLRVVPGKFDRIAVQRRQREYVASARASLLEHIKDLTILQAQETDAGRRVVIRDRIAGALTLLPDEPSSVPLFPGDQPHTFLHLMSAEQLAHLACFGKAAVTRCGSPSAGKNKAPRGGK